MKRYILLPLLVSSYFLMAKPLKIDEILTQQNNFRLDTTLAYSNIQTATNLSAIQTFQTKNGDVVNLPVYLGENKTNTDYLNYDFTLRYGVSKDIEVFASTNAYNSNTKNDIFGKFKSQSNKGFNALSLGFTYQIKAENDTPALLIGASSKIYEKTKINDKNHSNKFKNFRIFATSFYTVDPVVFLLNTSYSFNRKKDLGAFKRVDADILTISPQVYFAVNPYSSINWGIKYTHFGKTKANNKTIGNSGSNLSFLIGLSYELSSKLFVSLNAEFLNSHQVSQNTFSMTLSYKF